jgi:hypothetical protein
VHPARRVAGNGPPQHSRTDTDKGEGRSDTLRRLLFCTKARAIGYHSFPPASFGRVPCNNSDYRSSLEVAKEP